MIFKLFKKKKVNVDIPLIQLILENFIKDIKSETIIYITVKDNGVVTLHTNRPSVLIGKEGKDIEILKNKILKCGATRVYLKDMTHVVSNCGIY